MQTFLPYPDFAKSAASLDDKRLNKQITEGLQIYYAIKFEGGWFRHPASLMWKGHEAALIRYVLACCHEWIHVRGHKHVYEEVAKNIHEPDTGNPPWFGDERFHSAHRSILKGKNPAWYGDKWEDLPAVKDEKGRWPYFWPTKNGYATAS